MPSQQEEDRRRRRSRSIDEVIAQGFRITKRVYGDADGAGRDPRLWRPYRGCHRSDKVGMSMLRIGVPMVDTGVISRDEWDALMIAAAFRGAIQGLGPGADEQACAELAVRAMRGYGVFTRRDQMTVEDALKGLTTRPAETLSPTQELFVDAHGVQGMLVHNAESSLLRCIEDVTSQSGVVLPRTLRELGSVAIDPERVVRELENERQRIAEQQFHRPEVRHYVDSIRVQQAALGLYDEPDLLDVVSRRFRDDVDGGVAPGTALVRGVDSLEFRRYNGRLPNAAELGDWQSRGRYLPRPGFEGSRAAPWMPLPGDAMRWAPPSEAPGDLPRWLVPGPAIEPGRESVDETLGAIDEVLGGQDMPEPGSIDTAGDANGPEPPAAPRPPHAGGPAGGL